MGMTPAKTFAPPTPYGQSPDIGVLAQAQAVPQAPLNNFIPLNQPDPSSQQTAPQQQQPAQTGFQNQLGMLGYGGGAFRNMRFYQ